MMKKKKEYEYSFYIKEQKKRERKIWIDEVKFDAQYVSQTGKNDVRNKNYLYLFKKKHLLEYSY